MNNACDIAVIGGGPAGLAAAIAAAQALGQTSGSARVLLLEASDRVGRPILKTGNGRCNFSNAHIAQDAASCGYRNASFVCSAFEALQVRMGGGDDLPDPVLSFFEALGLAWRQEGEGRRYPAANKASVVVDVLRAAAAHAGVEELPEAKVVGIDVHEGQGARFTLRLADGRLIHAVSVVVACGAASVRACLPDDVAATEALPVLGPLACTPNAQATTKRLDNIRVKCAVSLMRPSAEGFDEVGSAEGELLFRSYGLSGICIFDLSRLAQRGDFVRVDVLRAGADGARLFLRQRRAALEEHFGQIDYAGLLRGLVLPRVGDEALRVCSLDEAALATDEGVDALTDVLSGWMFEVEGIGPADQCQVQRGGIVVDDIDAHTMQVRAVPGLYAAGEAIDADGPCGGYNLHWAWASGLLAGTCAAGALA